MWDPVVRVLRWWMAITLLAQFALAEVFLAEDALGLCETGEHALVTVHATFGIAFGAGLLARLLWLFPAPGSGPWRDLLPVSGEQRRTLLATAHHYLGGCRGEGPFYRAHNPLAAMVYAAFLLIALSQVTTGPGLYFIGEDTLGEAWEDVHEIGFWLIAPFAAAHLVMVVGHALAERRGLIPAMVNGRNLFTAEELERHPDAQTEEELR